jgi:hypothetical protein
MEGDFTIRIGPPVASMPSGKAIASTVPGEKQVRSKKEENESQFSNFAVKFHW